MEELIQKPCPRVTSAERCPYCHDQLDGVSDLSLIECPSCHTQHHEVCIRELGRCTVYGCEEPLEAPEREDAPPIDSPVLRTVRQRMRQRARSFVQDRARHRKDAKQEERSRLMRYYTQRGWRSWSVGEWLLIAFLGHVALFAVLLVLIATWY